jgi:hypothetical protein
LYWSAEIPGKVLAKAYLQGISIKPWARRDLDKNSFESKDYSNDNKKVKYSTRREIMQKALKPYHKFSIMNRLLLEGC